MLNYPTPKGVIVCADEAIPWPASWRISDKNIAKIKRGSCVQMRD